MRFKHKIMLLIDGVVNVLLGVLLLLFPIGVIELLGMPETNTHFYPSILGAVLLGIGLALLFELGLSARDFRGLGLGGAILINFIGSLVLILWLLFGNFEIPLKGRIILWSVGVIVFVIGLIELVTRSWDYNK